MSGRRGRRSGAARPLPVSSGRHDVACAFSGGADSTALLALAAAAGCHVTAIHVDHGLRPESAAEAARAQALATSSAPTSGWSRRRSRPARTSRRGPGTPGWRRCPRRADRPHRRRPRRDHPHQPAARQWARRLGGDGTRPDPPAPRPAPPRDQRPVCRPRAHAGGRSVQHRPALRTQPRARRAAPADGGHRRAETSSRSCSGPPRRSPPTWRGSTPAPPRSTRPTPGPSPPRRSPWPAAPFVAG